MDSSVLMKSMSYAWVLLFMLFFTVSLKQCVSVSETVSTVEESTPMAVEPALTHTRPVNTATAERSIRAEKPTLTRIQTASPVVQATRDSVNVATSSPTVTTVRPYGVTYVYPKIEWSEADRPAIRERLEYLQELGVNTIVQAFSSDLIGTDREKDWLILLDEAERYNMKVVVRLWPPIEWDGETFDFHAIQSFLSVVQDHQALLAYAGLHEPLERFNSDQLREFYVGVKKQAPQLAIAHYMGDMALFEEDLRLRFPGRNFKVGICDICIVWYYPFRYTDEQPVFEEDIVRETIQNNRRLIDERAPDTQLWFLGQAYALHKHKRHLRMPTPEEMERLYRVVQSQQVDGFLWYPWLHGNCDQVLSDPEMEPQRLAVRGIYERHVLQRPPRRQLQK